MGTLASLKVVDAHAHVIEHLNGIGYRGELRPLGKGRGRWATGEEMQIIPPGLGERSFTGECLIRTMDAAGVAKAVLLQGSLYGFQNEYSCETALRYPDRFACLGSFDPYCLKAKAIMRRWVEECGVRGLKFEMSSYGGFMGFHPDFAVDGPGMKEVWSYAEKHGLVISLDIGTFGTASFQLSSLLDIATRHPGVRIVIEHMFCPGAGVLDKVRDSLSQIAPYRNICVTLASLPSMSTPEKYPYPSALSYARAACDIIGSERVMWGSDAPISLVDEDYPGLLGYIPDSGLFSAVELQLIFSENARRIYGL